MPGPSWADTSKQDSSQGRGTASHPVPAAKPVVYPLAMVSEEMAGSIRTGRPPSAPAVSFLLQLQRTHGNRYVQRMLAQASKSDHGSGDVEPEVESAIARSRGNGHSMGDAIRGQMESAFGYDFTGVRIHTGAQAHSLNRAVSAVAFTTGQDIFFRDGAYSPESRGGKELLAHELTHVVQQGGSGHIQSKLAVGDANSPYEHEANHVASLVMRDLDAVNSSESGSVQRQCACGGRAESGGECTECSQAR
jgi:hypothetical protein